MAVSYSGIEMYNTCPSSFDRKYNKQEPVMHPPTPETAPAMFRGTKLHGAIEDLLNEKRNDLPKELSKYTQFCIGLRTQGAVAECDFAFNAEWESVDFEDPTAEVRGFMDCKLVTENDFVIYEWKTGKKYYSHANQRSLYGLAGLILHPEHQKVRVITTYLDQGENDQVVYHAEMLSTYKWVWSRYINKTKPPQPYPMRPTWKCKFCNYSKRSGGKCPN